MVYTFNRSRTSHHSNFTVSKPVKREEENDFSFYWWGRGVAGVLFLVLFLFVFFLALRTLSSRKEARVQILVFVATQL